MKYSRLILIIGGVCVVGTIVTNFIFNAMRATNPDLGSTLLLYANTVDGIGIVVMVLLFMLGGRSPVKPPSNEGTDASGTPGGPEKSE